MSKLDQSIAEIKCNPGELRRIFTEVSLSMTDDEWLLLAMDMDTFCEMFMWRVNDGIKGRANSNKCQKCGGSMIDSKAIEQTCTGIPDFPGGDICTMSPGGSGKLIDCLKCDSCGWSVTK